MSAALDFAEALATMAESLQTVLDAVDGHRAQLIERGYSPTAAEVGAMELHQGMIRMIFTPAGGAK